MEWNKAKNIIIFFMIMLNIMLGIVIFMGRERYSLSDNQERNIVEVLYRNNITFNTPIIRNTRPMRTLELSPGVFSDAEMAQVFLGNANAPMVDEGGNMRHYYYNGAELIIFENIVIFENNNRDEFMPVDFDSARRMSDSFLAGLGNMARGFILDVGPYSNGAEIIIEYRQRREGITIFNNYFLIAIDDYGIRRVEYSHNRVVGLSASANAIVGADEALFSFLRAMRMESVDRPPRIIEKMDIVYFMDPRDIDLGSAYPYFRIYYREYLGDGEYAMRLIIVNAYLNTWRVIL